MGRLRIASERSFPRVQLATPDGGRPVEVLLIAQLDPGAGDTLAAQAGQRQASHPRHDAALDEPSALLSPPDFSRDDPTSLFSFSVGPYGHPFHRHAGRRLFTAISGSGGARLRFAHVCDAAMAADPAAFLSALRHVEVPPDCLFSVRFDGGTWHQFLPLRNDGHHPALFALSCHPDESAGLTDPSLQARAAAGTATIASLTELLPSPVQSLLDAADARGDAVPTTCLALHAPPDSWRQRACARIRSRAGRCRLRWQAKGAAGYTGHRGDAAVIVHARALPEDSLLHPLLSDYHYQDVVTATLAPEDVRSSQPAALLAALLEGFLEAPPASVGALMGLRNALVRPFGLRTAKLGCPVSSLASAQSPERFLQRFPVLSQAHAPRSAQVILGADDRHLAFRSCAAVHVDDEGQVHFSLSTRVRCRNLFGRAYMAVVDGVHRRHVAPTLLSTALLHVATRDLSAGDALSPVA